MRTTSMKSTLTCAATATVVLMSVAACEPGADTNTADSGALATVEHGIRDSAGVAIVGSPSPAPGSRLGWVVGDEPVVSIGTRRASDAFQLYRVGGATRLADARIVVANGGSNELLVFGADGSYLDSWAGEGDGPGEFNYLSTVHGWPGDSLIAGDSEEGRASVFDLTGAHGRTMSLRGPPSGVMRLLAAAGRMLGGESVAERPHTVISVIGDGALLTRTPRGFRQGLHRWESAYALMGGDGSTRAALGDFLGIEVYSEFYERDDGHFMVVPVVHPFGRATLSTAWGDLAAIGDNETYVIRAYRSDGSLARIVRRDHQIRTPTQSEQDAAFLEQFAGLSDESREPRMAAAESAPLAEGFPAYSGLRGDALGHLWVAEFRLPDATYEGTLWTVFDGEGRALGFVETPTGLTVFEIGEDYVLGSATDDVGAESVQLWGLSRD